MIDQKLDNPPTPNAPKEISRRKFLKLSALTMGGALTKSKIGNWFATTYGDDVLNKIEQIELSLEAKTMMSEIIAFRESLGLEGLPAEVQPGLLKKEQWSSNPDNYVDALPEKNKSYSLRIFEVIQKLFGINATRIIKGSKPDPRHPYGMSFETDSRLCNISELIHYIPIQDRFTDFVLHEACGHGSDPALGASYPPEILIRVEHGKWRALSQALSIPDQFLNHPRDLMFPLLKRSIGETVGRYITGVLNSPIVDNPSVLTIDQEVSRIARAKGKDGDSLKFNKRVCKEVGESLVALLRGRKIRFVGDLKKTYQDKLEDAGVEIYAEMVKYALIHPDQIQNNTHVVGGITEIISAIQGKSLEDLAALRNAIAQPSEEVLKRNEAEKAMISPATSPSPSPAPTLSPEEQERARKQQEDFERRERAFRGFVENGIIPETIEILDNQRETVQKFTTLYCKIIQKYPMLKDTFAQQYDESFDPEIHIWEIQEIETAMDSGFVRDLTGSQSISGQMITDITNRNKILERFANSSAF